MTDEDLEELRAQTETGDRIDTESDVETDDELVDEIATNLEAIERGDLQKTVSVWDAEIAALARALDERPEDRQRIADALAVELGAESAPSDAKKSHVLIYALRIGLRSAPDDVLDAIDEAEDRLEDSGLTGL